MIGSGPNGLVAANILADAGWEVTVCEAAETAGGAVASDAFAEGFVADRFSAFYPLAAASPVIESLGLERFGLRWRHAPAVVAHPFADGRCAALWRDVGATAESLEALQAGAGEAWAGWHRIWSEVGEELLEAIMSPFPPLLAGARLARSARRVGWAHLARFALGSVESLQGQTAAAPAAALLAGSALHADVGLDAAGSAFFGWLLSMVGHSHGWPVPEGGAGRLARAMADRFTSKGGRLLCSAEVSEVVVSSGRAVGVRTAAGDRYGARRAVIAAVGVPQLYLRLLADQPLPAEIVATCRRFPTDFPLFKVDWALGGKIPWLSPEAAAAGTVHLGGELEEMIGEGAQLRRGIVAAEPFLVLGQMTTADETRSPAGTESAWAYGHLPRSVASDGGGDGVKGDWGASDLELLADRAQRRIESFAPGFSSLVLARRVVGPKELAAADANLLYGTLGGGTMALHNQALLRPFAGTGRPETPIGGLFLASSYAHPGPGVHGACGANAARAALLWQSPIRGRLAGTLARAWSRLSGDRPY